MIAYTNTSVRQLYKFAICLLSHSFIAIKWHYRSRMTKNANSLPESGFLQICYIDVEID